MPFPNQSDRQVKVLVFDTPSGFEEYYEDLQRAFAEGKDIEQKIGEI